MKLPELLTRDCPTTTISGSGGSVLIQKGNVFTSSGKYLGPAPPNFRTLSPAEIIAEAKKHASGNEGVRGSEPAVDIEKEVKAGMTWSEHVDKNFKREEKEEVLEIEDVEPEEEGPPPLGEFEKKRGRPKKV